MRALVAGGAGFIGSHLCGYLLEQGFDVLCVDNLLTGSRRNVAHGYRRCTASISRTRFLCGRMLPA